MIDHAVILAAGRGIRLMPRTKKIPKAMVKIKNQTLILRGIKRIQKYIKNICNGGTLITINKVKVIRLERVAKAGKKWTGSSIFLSIKYKLILATPQLNTCL